MKVCLYLGFALCSSNFLAVYNSYGAVQLGGINYSYNQFFYHISARYDVPDVYSEQIKVFQHHKTHVY